MRYQKLLSVMLLIMSGFTAVPAFAQIEITANEYRNFFFKSGNSFTTFSADSADALRPILNAKGGNQTWDFTAITYDDAFSATFDIVQAPVPGSDDPALADANLILRFSGTDMAGRDSSVYTFQRLDDDGLSLLGSVATFDADPSTPEIDQFKFTYTPPWLQQKLPLNVNTSWIAETAWNFGTEENPFMSELRDSSVVEGWGTLITPAGSAQALRVYSRTITSSTISIPGFPDIVSSDTSYSIDFVTEKGLSAGLSYGADGELFASYSTSTAGTVDAESPDELPVGFALEQNYPNPFNPSTTIPFTLQHPGHVTLKVFNVLGEEISTLVDDSFPAGNQTITWNAAYMPSGVYIYRLAVDGQVLSKHMTLMK